MSMTNPRPTSPHLQIYKLPLTGLISISHRITGVLLSVGLLFVVYSVWTAGSVTDFQSLQQSLQLGIVRLMYWGFVFALFFHLCHGVRHLFWDIGQGFDRAVLNRYACIELCATAALTFITFVLAG